MDFFNSIGGALGSFAFEHFVMPIITSAILALVTWIGTIYTKFTGEKLDQKHQTSLQMALESGFRYAAQKVMNGKISPGMDPVTRENLITEATTYARKSVPGAIKHFKLNDWDLGRLLLPKFPITTDPGVEAKK